MVNSRRREINKMSNSVSDIFNGIADAIRAIDGTQTSMTPMQMPQRILDAFNVSGSATTPSATLPSVFQAIANSIRAVGASGSMTPVQMPSLLQALNVHPETRVKYVNNTTDTFNISGVLAYNDITDMDDVAEIDIGNTVTSIDDSTFYQNYNLTSVTFPNSLTSIGSDAFYGCNALTSVTIPASVTSIGSYAFSGCSGVTSFTVDSNNQYYKSVHGNLLTKDGQTLVVGLNVSNVTIPSGVTTIVEGAFENYSNMTSVTIGNNATTINTYAFYECNG